MGPSPFHGPGWPGQHAGMDAEVLPERAALRSWAVVDGNEAAARVAYAASEVIAIYPITPASP